MEYKKRIADGMLRDKLDAMGAILIEGPKACGKTTTAEQIAGSVLYMDDPDKMDTYLQLVDTNIKLLLAGETPRLIDEWQIAPKFWDAIRHEVDRRDEDGQFILTGSAVPADSEKIFHSGAARYGFLTMRTMSLWESGESSGSVSLGQLFRGVNTLDGRSSISIEDLAYLTCRGGWPSATKKKTRKAALTIATEYYEAITRTGISRADGVSRDEERAKRIMRSYARQQGSQATIPTILADISSNEQNGISDETIASYIKALKKIFVIEDMKAWNPNLRSKTAIRTSDTRYYTDPSIAVAALGVGPEDLLNDPNTFGLLFETMAVRDLRVYADSLGGDVYHFRDKEGLECDAVVHLRNGSYGLVEIKLGGETLIKEGVATLTELAGKIDTEKMKAPSFLMVLTGIGEYPYRRAEDGVLVVPIGCLKD